MGRSVLIVDDNSEVRRTLWRLFTQDEDFEVCGEAGNGREAIETAQELQPDLVVTDLSMPV
jgi:YesN/AraC family two-component response regulator